MGKFGGSKMHLWRRKSSTTFEMANSLLQKNEQHTNLKDDRVSVDEECPVNHSGRRQWWCWVKHPAKDGIWFRGESRPGRPEETTTNVEGDHLPLTHCDCGQFFRFRLKRGELFMMGGIYQIGHWTFLTSSNQNNSENWFIPSHGEGSLCFIVTGITIGQEQANYSFQHKCCKVMSQLSYMQIIKLLQMAITNRLFFWSILPSLLLCKKRLTKVHSKIMVSLFVPTSS